MPRYGMYSDPADYYQGTAFDPFSGRLNGGQLVAQILTSIAAGKRKKKEEAWELEDRARQKQQFDMAQANFARQQEAAEYEKSQRIPWQMQQFMEGIRNAKAQQDRLELERVRGENDRKLAEMKTPADKVAETNAKTRAALDKARTRALQDIESRFTADIKSINAEHAKSVSIIRKPNAKGEIQGRVESATGSPYMLAMRGANSSRARQIKEREARKAQEIEAIERSYASGDIDGLVGATIPQEVLEAARQARPDLSDAEIIAAWKAKK